MSLKTVKRLAAEMLKSGISRIRLNKTRLDDLSKALTREDVRGFIKSKDVYALPEGEVLSLHGAKRSEKRRKGQRRGAGKRRGTKKVRTSERASWRTQIRSQRAYLKELMKAQVIDRKSYRKLYLLSKGNMFKGKKAIVAYAEAHSMKKK